MVFFYFYVPGFGREMKSLLRRTLVRFVLYATINASPFYMPATMKNIVKAAYQ